mmetsp:Transcript_34512/g.60129  ORF Transcript_34512/g.60129 Transcript_34512/m.60129 type:complete len:349 (+) Transcript_34512:87-1133(+)
MIDVEQRRGEAEALASMFGEDFFEMSPSEWVLRCSGPQAKLTIHLPDDHPCCSPPILVLDMPGHAGLDQACQSFLQAFAPGEEFGISFASQFYEFCESLRCSGDSGIAIESRAVQLETSEASDSETATEALVTLKPDMGGEIGLSLANAGFVEHGAGVFVHGELGAAVEIHEQLHVSIDGIDAMEELADWVTDQLTREISSFGDCLLKWANAHRAAGEVDDGSADGVVDHHVATRVGGTTTLTGNAAWKARLQAGEIVEFRGKGNSLHPRIKSGECCRYAPVFTHDDIKEKDVVFCQIKGRYWDHLVKKKTFIGGRDEYEYTISNIHGWENGTCTLPYIYGKVIAHWK